MPQFDSEIVPIYRDFMKLKIFMFWAATVLILPSGPRVSAEPFPSIVKVAYEGYLGPLYLLSAAVEISMDDGVYRIATNFKTEGFANWFFYLQNQAVSEGRRGNRGIVPLSFRMKAFWNDKSRNAKLKYVDGSPILEKLLPPPEEVENKAVPHSLITETIDPLSMALRMLSVMGNGKECPGTYKVFDGRRRYDLAFTDERVVDLAEESSSIVRGAARRCKMAIERVSGFWDKSKLITETRETPFVWMARPLKNGPLLPVKFESIYKFGKIRIYLTRLEVDDKIIALD
ncbi:MAG: hypothetical protein CMM28_12495 [Rhodospirillaceae bacterium]|nr:hypothetical protein [Rhodospirillaceae bacterium]